ncbi:MAG: hypothetical protein IPH11_04860 [Ignavibacteriales bacterium]|nr:hypothetical protein [Ignavibacteriales bacterium]
MKNYESRISKLERVVQEILNPDYNRSFTIIVDERVGETLEGKILEMEKELGKKINRSNLSLLFIRNYGSKDESL